VILWRVVDPSAAGVGTPREELARPEIGRGAYAPGDAPADLLARSGRPLPALQVACTDDVKRLSRTAG
jgi:hypothetical protein